MEIQDVLPDVDLVEMERSQRIAGSFTQGFFPASEERYESAGDGCAGGIQYDSGERMAVGRFAYMAGGLARLGNGRHRDNEPYRDEEEEVITLQCV